MFNCFDYTLSVMSLLSAAYVKAYVDESKEEQKQKKEERIQDLKTKVFCYAVRHKLLYNQVVELIQNDKLTFEDINADREPKK